MQNCKLFDYESKQQTIDLKNLYYIWHTLILKVKGII